MVDSYTGGGNNKNYVIHNINTDDHMKTTLADQADINASQTQIEVKDAVQANIGYETRPKNMKVQFIIRVY